MEGANTNLVLDERTIGARTVLHSESLQEENGDSDEASNVDMSTNSLNRDLFTVGITQWRTQF